MIAADSFVAAFGSVPPGDDEATLKVIIHAVRLGFAVVLCKPDDKVPLCTLNARDRNRADREAQEAAAAAGDPGAGRRRHACGLAHALTASMVDDPTKLAPKIGTIYRRLVKERGRVNVGVELGRSRMLVVDVDTAEQAAAFRLDWQQAVDYQLGPEDAITVQSPGRVDVNGKWVHKDGGHYWFTLPDNVELPHGMGSWPAPSGWVAMWADHQVLVPPSFRPEGPYVLVGQPQPAPEWLIDRLLAEGHARAERQRQRATSAADGSSDIDQWSAAMPWGELLEPDGWIDTGLPDTCGCPKWTAPGPHASRKSATAHDLACDVYDLAPGHAPLKVWTDNPPEWMAEAKRRIGKDTFTRLQYIAWRDHDGVIAAALADLGLTKPGPGGNGLEWDYVSERPEMSERQDGQDTQDGQDNAQVSDEFGVPGAASDDSDEEESQDSEPVHEPTLVDILRSHLVDSAGLDEIEDPEPLLDGFLDLDTIARVTGKSGHGKSFVMLDIACCIATGRPWHGFGVHPGPVVYMVAEGLRGTKKRIRAWENRFNDGKRIPREQLMLLKVPVQTGDAVLWRAYVDLMTEISPVLCVLDTQARITVGVDENDATAMGIFVERLEAVRRATGACVVPVHHLGHAGEHGRGSTAVLGALGTELRVTRTGNGKLTIESEKQKDRENTEPLKFLLDPEEDSGSVVLVADGWDESGDPWSAPAPSPGAGVGPESSVRDRLAAIIWHVFSHGDGTNRTEARALLITGTERWGRASKSRSYTAWNDLVRDKVLIQQTNADGKLIMRWKLSPAEAQRLGLEPPDPGSVDNVPNVL